MENRSLSGWVWMLAGIALIAYTRFIVSKQPASKIGYFIWIGVAFLIYGAVKEFLPRLRAKRPEKVRVGPPPANTQHPIHQQQRPHPAMPAQGMSPHASHQHVQPHPHPSYPHTPTTALCPRCHRHVPGHAHTCYNCGFQFR